MHFYTIMKQMPTQDFTFSIIYVNLESCSAFGGGWHSFRAFVSCIVIALSSFLLFVVERLRLWLTQ